MKTLILVPVVSIAVTLQSEPALRRLTVAPLKIDGVITHISAAGELAGGGILVTDQNAPAIWLIDPSTGKRTQIGSSGGDERQYIQPGGIYRGSGKTTLVLDRAQSKVLVLSPTGEIERTYSVAERGVTGSSSMDVDLKRLDARGLAYFVDRERLFSQPPSGAAHQPAAAVVRFDPVKQQKTPVVSDLRLPEQRSRSGGENVVLTQQVIGSGADGWGVAPDGRVAIIRAAPYRVEWISATGAVTRGPVVPYDPLPMTDADKQAFLARFAKGASIGGVGTGGSGQTTQSASPPERLFASTKPPFAPDDVLVSPDNRVWVLRSSALGATEITYDVFDAAGARVDRIGFPSSSRVVGFGANAVYVREIAAGGGQQLRKYPLK